MSNFDILTSIASKSLRRAVTVRQRYTDLPQAKAAWVTFADEDAHHAPGFVVRMVRSNQERPNDRASGELRGVINYFHTFVASVEDDGEWSITIRQHASNTLKELIAGDCSSELSISEMAAGVAIGVDSLHSRNLTHGILRPSKVIVSDVDAHLQLSDYALPTTGQHAFEFIRTKDARYLAPEIVDGLQSEPTMPADIYALGAIMEELADCGDRASWYRRIKGRESWQDLRSIAIVCQTPDAADRPGIRAVMQALQGNRDVLLQAIMSPERRYNVTRHVLDAFGRDSDVGRWLRRSQPLERATETALDWLYHAAERDIAFCLRMQSESQQAKYASNLAFSALQDYKLSDHVVQRQLGIEERHLSTGRNVHPPDLDDAWRDELFERHRELLVDIPLPGYGTDSERLAELDRYNFSAQDVFLRLEKAVAAASTLRRNILESVTFLRTEDVIAQQGSVDNSELNLADVEQLVDSGILLALTDHDKLLFPSFQFIASDRGVVPRPEVLRVNKVLGDPGRGWARVLWWLSPAHYLDDSTPVSLLDTNKAGLIVDFAMFTRKIP